MLLQETYNIIIIIIVYLTWVAQGVVALSPKPEAHGKSDQLVSKTKINWYIC